MILYLFRHADARTDAEVDNERRLSDKGVRQSRRVGNFCARKDLVPAVILTSPLIRARETAEAFASECKVNRLMSVEFLRPGMLPEQAIAELKGYHEFDSVMIVGHEPDFGRLVAALVGLSGEGEVVVRKASLIALELPTPELTPGRLLFSIPVKHMSR